MKRGKPLERRARLGPATYAEALARARAAPKKRQSPLRAKRWGIAWKPARRIARETETETLHKHAIREMRVCAASKYKGAGRCRGPLQLAHLGPSGGMGAKHGTWDQATMMCMSHHDQWDGREKPSCFDRMTPEERARFADYELHLAREFVAGRLTEAA